MLEVVVLGDVGRFELLRWRPSVYRGTHVKNPKVVTMQARTVRIEAAEPLPVHDGEPVGTTLIAVTICPGALRLRRAM